ncbi:MAG: NAD(P)H-binding protein [Umezawaea sp.]
MQVQALEGLTMKLLLLGATGATGHAVLTLALRAGHEVTVFVRDPTAMRERAGQVRIAIGDATSAQDLAAVLPGHDAVISALGSGKSIKSDIASRAATALVVATRHTGVSRLVVLSAFGVGDSLDQTSTVQKLMYRTVMRSLFADKAIADDLIRAGGQDWTLVHPVTLTNGPATDGAYRAGDRLPMKGMPKISRADVATFMLTAAADPAWIHRTAVLSD